MTWFGPKCPRCDTRNDKTAEFCEHCGISMAAPRPAILKGNRWEAADDEFAVFFKGRDLKGLFSKTLVVPAKMRGWVLQDNRAEELQEGEYTLETLPERLNTFFSGKHAEILIARPNAISIPFRFDDIPSAELLQVTVEANIHLKVGGMDAFRSHFMLRPGVVTVPQLRELLGDSVRQIVVENLGGLHLEEMSTRPGLRQELAKKIEAGLQQRFNGYGLAFNAVDTLSIRHDRFDANRNLMGSLWLDLDEAKRKAEHQKTLDELYNQEAWARIKKREQDLRRRYRESELSKEEVELAQILRLSELEQFKNITESETRKAAIEKGAKDEIESLDHNYLASRRQREQSALGNQYKAEDEETGWKRTRELAAIRHQADLRVETLYRDETEKIEQQRIENLLERIAIEGEIERARLIDDEEERKRQQANNAELLLLSQAREETLLNARHRLAVDEVDILRETKQREAARIQAWEDKVLEEKLASVDLRIDGAKTGQGLDTLERMMRMKSDYDKSQIQLQLEDQLAKLKAKREQNSIDDEAAEKALDRKLIEQQAQLDTLLKNQEHEKEMLRIKGSLPTEVLLSLCDNPQSAGYILDLAKTKTLINATPEQIQAILSTSRAQTAYEPGATATFQTASTGDSQSDALRKYNDELRSDHAQVIVTLTRANELAQSNMVEMARLMKETAVGVAQAHGGTQAHSQPTQQAAPQAQQAANNHFTMPFSLKTCPKCNAANLADALSCGKCKQDF